VTNKIKGKRTQPHLLQGKYNFSEFWNILIFREFCFLNNSAHLCVLTIKDVEIQDQSMYTSTFLPACLASCLPAWLPARKLDFLSVCLECVRLPAWVQFEKRLFYMTLFKMVIIINNGNKINTKSLKNLVKIWSMLILWVVSNRKIEIIKH